MSDTANGLSPAGELRMCELSAIADALAAVETERRRLHERRTFLFAECRLDDPPVPLELLAGFARVSRPAVLIQLRAEEVRRGLPRHALGRGRSAA